MFDDIAELLIKNVRKALDQNWQSKSYSGQLKRGSGPKRATSSLYNNIDYEIEYDENGLPESFVIFMEDYWYWVDKGRRPGGFPPIDDIKGWIRNKPVTFAPVNGKIPTLDQQAYMIGRSIAEKGSYKTDFTKIATDTTLNESIELFGEAYAEQIQEFLDIRLFAGSSQRDLLE